MAVNRLNIKASTKDKSITIPIGQTFDEIGNEQLVRTWEEVELQDNINVIQDYETTRYAYKNNISGNTISYEFNFWDYANQEYPIPTPNFNVLGFADKELAKPKKAFTRSFFKFDFYDSPLRKEQKIMFTNIMSLNNCIKVETAVEPITRPHRILLTNSRQHSNTNVWGVCSLLLYWVPYMVEVKIIIYNG